MFHPIIDFMWWPFNKEIFKFLSGFVKIYERMSSKVGYLDGTSTFTKVLDILSSAIRSLVYVSLFSKKNTFSISLIKTIEFTASLELEWA